MRGFILLSLFLQLYHTVNSSDWPLKKKSIIDGDIVLGGFFPIHARDNERICGRLQDEGLLQLEAMLYAVEKINNDSSLLPGVRLGVIAVDSCDSIPRALEEAVDFAKGFVIRDDSRKSLHVTPPFTCGSTALPHFESGIFEKVVAIVGGHSSWVSRQVADLMKIYKVPQVSYQSTSPSLSDIGYEYFFRTVPPLNHQMKVIAEILRSFKWKYFAIVYADSDYGNRGVEVLKKLMQGRHKSLCISSQQRINVENSKVEDYDFVMSELLKRNATAVIVFGDHAMARNLMFAATRARAYRRFVWIGSTAWVGREYVITGNEAVLEGSLGIIHDLKPFQGFDDYLKSNDLDTHRMANPWFPEYWEEHLDCRIENFDETPFNRNYSVPCNESAQLPPSCYKAITPSVQFVRDAVYAVAHALQGIYDIECKGNKLCLEYRSMIGEELRKYLSTVKFEDENKNLFQFNDKGDGPPRYTVVNLQKDPVTETLYWVPVGTYYVKGNESVLEMNSSSLVYKHEDPEFPESYCSASCREGQAKILLDEASCCWHCTDCDEFQYVEEGVRCKDCPQNALPNFKRDGCEPMVAEYMDFPNAWAVGCLIFSVSGILMTLSIAVVVGNYWDTPVFMASGREFSFVLLVGIVLSFSLSFAIVSKPSAASCGIVRFFLGMFYTISYATIAAKTHYLSKLNARKEANKKPKRINTKSLVLTILALVVVDGALNLAWVLHSPPSTDYQYTSRANKVLICRGSDSAGYLVGLVFPFILMIFSTVYALRIRNFTGAFYESRYIGFTNYTTFILWFAFLPMFLLIHMNLLRVVVLSLLLSVSSLVQLVCLFLPKVYLALRRPEKNKHENVMGFCDAPRESVHTSI